MILTQIMILVLIIFESQNVVIRGLDFKIKKGKKEARQHLFYLFYFKKSAIYYMGRGGRPW